MISEGQLSKLTIADARRELKNRTFSSVELVDAYLKEIEKKDGDVHAFLELFEDARDEAQNADERISKGEDTALLGIPFALKDNILINRKHASAGSKILEGYTATYDSTVTKKLKDAGAVILGRTNMDEFAMGSSTENSAFGITKNPHDLTRVPGGSSGGSAASVAMGGALAALGSDTGGSVRQPAALCGVVGLKPTYGAVSRYGLIAMGSSLDQIGPFTKTVSDSEAVFNAIKGHDPLDSTSLPDSSVLASKEKITVGVPFKFLEKGVDPDILENLDNVIKKLESKGHTVKEIDLPSAPYSLAVYYILMPAEASTNLARFDGVRYGLHKEGKSLLEDYVKTRTEGFGREVKRRILLGTYVLSAGYYDAYYAKAEAVRNLITSDYLQSLHDVDTILTPTTPSPAFKIGEKSDPLSMYLNDIFTVPANLTGMPALAVPSGKVIREGKELPVSLQFVSAHGREDILFQAGKEIE